MVSIDFVKKHAKSHKEWVKGDKKQRNTFDKVEPYTMTVIGITNWEINLEEMYNKIPIVEYHVVPKKRGRKSSKIIKDRNEDIPVGSVTCLIYKRKIRGVKINAKPSKDATNKFFRNSLTMVIKVGKLKFVNCKVSENGTIQMTGPRILTHIIISIHNIWRYIRTLSTVETPIFKLKDDEEVPRCIINIVTTNISYHIGYNINRERLDSYINTRDDFISIYEPSYKYSGINVKLPSEQRIDTRMTALYWRKDGSIIITKGLYSKYIDLLPPRKREKQLTKEKLHTWLVFQTGSVIQSGPNYEEMKLFHKKFMKIITERRKEFEEVIDE